MCPIGIDQAERESQHWQLLVPRLKQNQLLPLVTPPHQDYKLLFDENGGWDAWSRLARPAAHTDQILSKGNYRSRGPVSRLESFPAEILAMILSCSELSKLDIISLGMASETLWPHTIHFISKDYRHSPSVGPWAGCEIACVGSDLTELPPSFEKDDLAFRSVSLPGGGEMRTAKWFSRAASVYFTSPQEYAERNWRGAFDYRAANQMSIPKMRIAQMSEDLLLVTSTTGSSPADSPWMLRNLTTKQFVRCVPRADSKGQRGYIDHPDCKGLHVSDILTMRIRWTQPHNWDTITPFNMCGPWAGHSFDIVALDENRAALSEAWVDVTDAIVEEANKHLETLSEDKR